MQYAVRSTQYAVCVSAKRSSGTVDLANMVVGLLPLYKKVKPTQWGMQWVRSMQWVHSTQWVCSTQ